MKLPVEKREREKRGGEDGERDTQGRKEGLPVARHIQTEQSPPVQNVHSKHSPETGLPGGGVRGGTVKFKIENSIASYSTVTQISSCLKKMFLYLQFYLGFPKNKTNPEKINLKNSFQFLQIYQFISNS